MAKKHKEKKHSEEEGGEAWLLPYSDLMTLLLAVFIVLFAVSKVDQTKAEEISNAFKGMFESSSGVMSEGEGSVIPREPNGVDEMKGGDNTEAGNAVSQEELEAFLGKYEVNNLQELQTRLDAIFEHEEMSDLVSTNVDLRGLVITLNNAIVFNSGSADIKPEYESSLIKIADIIRLVNNHIRVEGHTDNRPINTSTYPSNWELSTARAAGVVRLFIEKGKIAPERVVAVGYGEYKPVADNSTEEGKEKNRRIDIIVLSEKYDNLEEQFTTGKVKN
ncbi:MAG: chemotaxis protein MotB [Anaerocolumna sp.]|nr:chemotaxis protein MotB [Anaerocolumna sp.]